MELQRLTTNSDTFYSWRDKINALIEALEDLRLATDEEFKNGVQGSIPNSEQIIAYLDDFKKNILEELSKVDEEGSVILTQIQKTVDKEVVRQNVDAITYALLFGE